MPTIQRALIFWIDGNTIVLVELDDIFDEVCIGDRTYFCEYASDVQCDVFLCSYVGVSKTADEFVTEHLFWHGVLDGLHLWICENRIDRRRISLGRGDREFAASSKRQG